MRSKKQTKNHSQKLVDAMKSIYTSSTPLSSILPVQEKIKVAGTSPAGRGKGTRAASGDTMPQKLLLQITDPGSRPAAPTAPKAVANPYALVDASISKTTAQRDAAVRKGADPRPFDKQIADLQEQRNNIRSSILGQNYTAYLNNLNQYQTDLSRYNRVTLPNYNTALAQYTSDRATNTARTSQYERDLAKFLATNGKRKVSKKKATRTRGSRNPGYSASKGSR